MITLKLTINQHKAIPETEIIINCPEIDQRVRNLIDYIRQYSVSLPGAIDNMCFRVPLDTILYIESVDRKTFFYDKHRAFRNSDSLTVLENKLENTLFVRISKNCIVNITHITSTYNCENHKLGILLDDGERLIAGRTYAQKLQAKINSHRMNLDETEVPGEYERLEHALYSIRNYNRILRFQEIPQRIITITYTTAELLCALGLESRIVGVASVPEEIGYLLPAYREKLKHIPTIQCTDLRIPLDKDLEALEPDFIYASYYYQHYLERHANDSPDIPLYITEASIPGKNTIESVYRDILNLGKIFHIENRAVLLIEQLRGKISRLPLRPAAQRPPKVFVYDNCKNSPVTSYADTLENNLIALAGGRNIFSDRAGAYHPVTWEAVAAQNPDFIIVHEYYDFMGAEEKIEWIRNLPELKECTAVKTGGFIIMTLAEIFPGIQNASAIEKMFFTFYPELI